MTAVSPETPFEMEILVAPADIDRMGHVNNVVYLHWVQDVAIAHWSTIASDNEQRSLLWVVIRHEIDYKRPAFEGERITARTWVGIATSRHFERHTEFIRASDRKLLAKVRTLWCPVDPITKRPVAAGEDVYARFSTRSDVETDQAPGGTF
jgi:acyl-CoA thioester hydrolase